MHPLPVRLLWRPHARVYLFDEHDHPLFFSGRFQKHISGPLLDRIDIPIEALSRTC